MAFQKFRADQLFDGYRFHNDQSVLVMKTDGTVSGIVPVTDAGDDIQGHNGILSPGFINCHCHLELSHMKGLIPEHTGLVKFVSQVMKDRHVQDEAVIQAIVDAETEMLDNGIVAVGDICNNKLAINQKIKRRIRYHNFIETSGFLPSQAETRFKRAVEIFNAYAEHYPVPVHANSIVPHAAYSVSQELWQLIIRFPGNRLVTIHNQETADENSLFQEKTGDFLEFYQNFKIDSSFFTATGKTSLQSYLPNILPNQQVILVHNVFTTAADLSYCHEIGQNRLIYWCLCPNANSYISAQLPDLSLLMKYTDNIVLGTDSLASNRQLSILAEMNALLQYYPLTKKEKLFGWATLNGAKALQLDHILGSFEPGKKPGLVLSDTALTKSKRLL